MSNNSNQNQKLFGAILLIAGCCMGAGMLGLPLVTASLGLFPTVIAFTLSWAFMAITGLLLLEVNLWFPQGANLLTLTEKTLGKGAKLFVGLLFTFLFQCLNVAYLIGGGVILVEVIDHFLGISLNAHFGSLLLAILFGGFVFYGTRCVDLVNRYMMAILFISYLLLLYFGIGEIAISAYREMNFSLMPMALPAMILSFGYHNLVPSLADYLDKNVKALRGAILLGTALPLLAYLIWDGMILGILPTGGNVQESIDAGKMVTALLQEATNNKSIFYLMEVFAFFALVTSFIAVLLSFVDFLADGLKVKKTTLGKLYLLALVLVPPLLFTYIYPTLFLTALNYAGAFGAVILFGIIPILMVYKGRYIDLKSGVRLVPGGKPLLLITAFFAIFVFLMQLKLELGI